MKVGSGKSQETPIVEAPFPEGFAVALAYGDDVHLYRNIVAADGCELFVDGQWNQASAIEPYPSEAGRDAFGYPDKLVLQVLQRHEFRLLRTA